MIAFPIRIFSRFAKLSWNVIALIRGFGASVAIIFKMVSGEVRQVIILVVMSIVGAGLVGGAVGVNMNDILRSGGR